MLNVVPITTPDEATFEDFWLLYPRREAKKAAQKAWMRMTSPQQMQAVVAMASWRKVFMSRESVNYIPLPASWLNGERWEDELPSEFRQITNAAHQQFKPEAKGERAPMPEHVRQLIASLKR